MKTKFFSKSNIEQREINIYGCNDLRNDKLIELKFVDRVNAPR